MLYNKQTQKLIPIDHGLTLLDSIDWLGNPGISETSCQWFAWPQISLPVNDEGKNWVLGYDIDANCQKMRMRGISAGSIREHKLRMTFLKVTIQKGYNLQEIGSMCMQTKETKEAVTFLDKKVMQTAAPMSDAERTNETVFLATFRQILETEL